MILIDPHEDALVRRLIRHDRRPEFLRGLSGSRKVRQQTVNQLAHFYDFVPGVVRELVEAEARPDIVYSILKASGAPGICHVISEGELDGANMDLREAIEAVFGSGWGTILSCVPGQLAYYEGENSRDRFILNRKGE